MFSEKVISKLTSTDNLSKKVYKSIIKFRNSSIKRSEISEKKYLDSRSKFINYE